MKCVSNKDDGGTLNKDDGGTLASTINQHFFQSTNTEQVPEAQLPDAAAFFYSRDKIVSKITFFSQCKLIIPKDDQYEIVTARSEFLQGKLMDKEVDVVYDVVCP